MFRLNENLAVWLHRDAIDFRKNINGLAAMVQHELGLDPFACAYVIPNRRRERVKILGWDRKGFWLLHKRLEQDRFVWPSRCPQVVELTVQQLHCLLDGIDLSACAVIENSRRCAQRERPLPIEATHNALTGTLPKTARTGRMKMWPVIVSAQEQSSH